MRIDLVGVDLVRIDLMAPNQLLVSSLDPIPQPGYVEKSCDETYVYLASSTTLYSLFNDTTLKYWVEPGTRLCVSVLM